MATPSVLASSTPLTPTLQQGDSLQHWHPRLCLHYSLLVWSVEEGTINIDILNLAFTVNLEWGVAINIGIFDIVFAINLE